MDALGLARWQFGITTVYHFLFVPITIGMAMFVAIMETAWVKTHNPIYLRATKFFGKLFLINFAIGVVTGIVQEFQFGMNWSNYSRFVGDIFGAPLAMEALLAFFIESTFIGIWIFGWNKLSPKAHAVCMWMVAFGTSISAYFILAANSFMQNPVGLKVEIDPATGIKRAYMDDITAVLFQKLQLFTFAHVITAAWLTAAVLIVAVCAYHMARKRHVAVIRPIMRMGLWSLLISSVLVIVSGDLQAKVMTNVQPMKMAAAEAQYKTVDGASFSVFSIGTLDGSQETFALRVPGVTSFMATGSFTGTVEGIDDIKAEYADPAKKAELEKRFGFDKFYPDDPAKRAAVEAAGGVSKLGTLGPEAAYVPIIPVAYWSFRLMMGAGFLLLVMSVVGLIMTRNKDKMPTNPLVWKLAKWSVLGGFVGNAFGWIFTEMGRQPWIVHGLYDTKDAVSPAVSAWQVGLTLVLYTAIYGVLAVIEAKLFFKAIKVGPPPEQEALDSLGPKAPGYSPPPDGGKAPAGEDVLTVAY